jgi:hypothetical protein
MKAEMKEALERMVPGGVITPDVEAACDRFIGNMCSIGQSHAVTARDVAFFAGVFAAVNGQAWKVGVAETKQPEPVQPAPVPEPEPAKKPEPAPHDPSLKFEVGDTVEVIYCGETTQGKIIEIVKGKHRVKIEDDSRQFREYTRNEILGKV